MLHNKQSVHHDDADCSRLVSTFSQFFIEKVARIRDSINNALQSTAGEKFYTRCHDGVCFSTFATVTVDEVRLLLSRMKCKSSPLDALPVTLLKSCVDVFAPVIVKLANISFTQGQFPACFKIAQVLPLLKKSGLDPLLPENYRPISNLNTISKVLERLALARLRPHLFASANFEPFQCGYRSGHSTETALLHVLDSVFTAGDDKQLTALIDLDISAAFDTIIHDTLITRLQDEFGVCAAALSWLKSYLSDRKQFVKLGQHSSPQVQLTSGVPQGSVLGPLLFTVYTSPVGGIIASHSAASRDSYSRR